MTLKNLFFSSMREDRKRRIWTIVVFSLICFMMTAVFELSLENILGRAENTVVRNNIYDLTESGMLVCYLLAAAGAAVLYGFHGFGWLTRKNEVDFYHSQPMKREKRFVIQYINGVLFFIIPMLLHLAVCGVLLLLRGYLDVVVLGNFGISFLVFTLAFLLMYSLVTAAVMLTGNMIVAFMASGVLMFYPSVIKMLITAYYETYFDTFVSSYSNPVSFLGVLSPWERMYQMAYLVGEAERTDFMTAVLIVAVMAVIFMAAAFFLYKKRASECAGKALAFPMFGDLIRFLIVIPGALAFGMMFAAWNGANAIFWLFFGTVTGVIITHGFMEVVFHFDIRAALKKKIQLVISIFLMIVLVSVFRFDLIRYDMYVPDSEDVKTAAYYIDAGERMDDYYELDENGVPLFVESGWSRNYISRQEHQLKVSTTTNVEPILKIVDNHNLRKAAEKGWNSQNVQFLVRYDLKNGKTEYRRYYIDSESIKAELETLYDTEEGKEVFHPYQNLSGEKVDSVYVDSSVSYSEEKVPLTVEEIKELAACYRKDIDLRTVDRLFHERTLGRIVFSYVCENGDVMQINLYVSDQDKNMMAFLEEQEVYLRLPNENYKIESAVAHNPFGVNETKNHPFWNGQEMVSLDEKEIEELLPKMMPDRYMSGNYDYVISVQMMVRDMKTGHIREVYYYLNAEDVPDYMKMYE